MPLDSWAHICDKIEYFYHKILGSDAADRPLTEREYFFFYSSTIWEGKVASQGELNISYEILDNFFEKWLKPVLEFLKRTGLWGRPQALVSFTSRKDAATMLSDMAPVLIAYVTLYLFNISLLI
jgi:hypothetical protein